MLGSDHCCPPSWEGHDAASSIMSSATRMQNGMRHRPPHGHRCTTMLRQSHRYTLQPQTHITSLQKPRIRAMVVATTSTAEMSGRVVAAERRNRARAGRRGDWQLPTHAVALAPCCFMVSLSPLEPPPSLNCCLSDTLVQFLLVGVARQHEEEDP